LPFGLKKSRAARVTAKTFQKILIANRGEIACRIIRTAKAMGYRTAAVFSDADADAPHVRLASEAVYIGPSAPPESYLKIDAILTAAKQIGADAIHPGYGFLAENAGFADACEGAGLVFIGPPAHVIRRMGDKAGAKAVMAAAGVPCLPGYSGQDQSDAMLTAEAERLGFPLLIKAAGGGGGRGIREVRRRGALHSQLAAARREGKNAFGDERLMLERLIERPKHIEVQVFGDRYGNIVHLFERDCTIQRRRQKIIEEAPCPVLTPAQRETLTAYAIQAARAVGYENAGTVEFIADSALNIYFLEMNTRLQVEHPVTELITGLDLVEWQLRVASGEPLPLKQDGISMHGHAIEARLCAEDPFDGFRPKTGTVAYWRPAAAEGIRIDSGVREGSEVTPFYDSMIAKAVAYGRSRDEAIRRLACALEDNPLLGVSTNQHFLAQLLQSEGFRQRRLAADTLDTEADGASPLIQRPAVTDEIWALAAALFAGPSSSSWLQGGGVQDFVIDLACGGVSKRLRYRRLPGGRIAIDGIALSLIEAGDPEIIYKIGGIRRRVIAIWEARDLHMSAGGGIFVFKESQRIERQENSADGQKVTAPAAGVVVQVWAQVGQTVEAGQVLAIIEAMKMETRVCALQAGKVSAVHVKEGDRTANASLLFEIEKLEEPANV
jgi:geranyl-CoA carboxylase alpha subunit